MAAEASRVEAANTSVDGHLALPHADFRAARAASLDPVMAIADPVEVMVMGADGVSASASIRNTVTRMAMSTLIITIRTMPLRHTIQRRPPLQLAIPMAVTMTRTVTGFPILTAQFHRKPLPIRTDTDDRHGQQRQAKQVNSQLPREE